MTTKSKIGSAILLVVITVLLQSWFSTQGNNQKIHTVEIKLLKFTPSELTVEKGDKVIWVNHDYLVHDVTELSNKAWSSDSLKLNDTWSMVVNESFDYHCTIHPIMTGKLIVE